MSSGISVTDAVVNAYNDLKLGKEKQRYVIFRISDDNREVIVDKQGGSSASFSDFCGELKPTECRYGIVDYEYTTADGRSSSKIVFFVWAPDSAPIKSKMLITSTKDAVKKKLVGLGIEVQATDFSELAPDHWKDRLN